MLFMGAFQDKNRTSVQVCMALSLGFFLLTLLLTQIQLQRQNEALAMRLSPRLLRFHILADSDDEKDQQVKLEVRSLILDYLKDHLAADADKEDTVACLTANRQEIEILADNYLKNRGFDYQAHLQPMVHCYFPSRAYGPYVFPCGYYDAARITLGKGKGHNWWCVLYPRFCFVDTACTAVPRESTRTLEAELNPSDYLAIQDNRPDIRIRFLFFPTLGETPVTGDPGKNIAAAKGFDGSETKGHPVSR